MLFNKKILLATLCMLFHGAILSMETDMELWKKTIGNIIIFARTPDHDPQHMLLLGTWLTEQRNSISETHTWNMLVEKVTGPILLCPCPCLEDKMTTAVRNIVKEVAYTLKPGQDCSQLLADRAQEAITITKREWIEPDNSNVAIIDWEIYRY